MNKPSEREDEYFARQEFTRRQKEARERSARAAEEERVRRKDLHWMCCPKCGQELVEMEFRAIKVDKCSGCEGVWFDAGEVDTLLKSEKGVIAGILGVFR